MFPTFVSPSNSLLRYRHVLWTFRLPERKAPIPNFDPPTSAHVPAPEILSPCTSEMIATTYCVVFNVSFVVIVVMRFLSLVFLHLKPTMIFYRWCSYTLNHPKP